MKKILAIRDSDFSYAEQLAKALNRVENSIFHAVVFSDYDALVDYEQHNSIDVLLYDENLMHQEGGSVQAECVVALSEVSVAAENVSNYIIFKYQSTDCIMQDIMKLYGRKKDKGDSYKVKSGTKIVSVCSPVGGSYSSTFALALATYFSKRKKTLFLSFDPFFNLPSQKKDPYDNNFTDVIYYLDQNEGDVCSHILSKISKMGTLYYISGASHWFDICDMRPEHMHRMLEELCNAEVYEMMVFDVGIVGVASMELLMVSEKIYMPVGNYGNSQDKINEWKRQVAFCGQMELIDKVSEVNLPYDEILDGKYDLENILDGRTGRIIEEMEGANYINR